MYCLLLKCRDSNIFITRQRKDASPWKEFFFNLPRHKVFDIEKMNPFLLEKPILFWYDVAGLPFLRTKQARLLLGTKWVGGKLETVSFQKEKFSPTQHHGIKKRHHCGFARCQFFMAKSGKVLHFFEHLIPPSIWQNMGVYPYPIISPSNGFHLQKAFLSMYIKDS